MSHRTFHLVRDRDEKKLESLSSLKDSLQTAWARQTSGACTLELRDDDPPKWWERMIYPLLGLKVPRMRTSLSLAWSVLGDDSWVYVTFEADDENWVPKVRATSENISIRLATEAGEPWVVRRQDCLTVEQATCLLEEFYQTGQRPRQIDWRRYGAKAR